MASQAIEINGKLINKSKQPLPNLRIEAWDKDLLVDDFVGEAVSNMNGNFSIMFTHKRYKELFFDNNPDIYFKIYADSQLIHNTEDSVLWNNKSNPGNIEITIDREEKSDASGTSNVKINFNGFVKHSNGNAVEKIKVILYEQLLRGKNQLAEAYTNKEGFYTVTISALSENTAYVLEVPDGQGNLLASSPVIFNPVPATSQDLIITDPQHKGNARFSLRKPFFQKYYEQLNTGPDKKPLTIEDVYFVANQTNLEPRDTFHWLRANELETETTIPAEAFYGLFSQGLPTNPKALSSKGGQEIRDALQKAAENSFVSDDIALKSDEMVSKWNEYIIAKALDEVPQKMDASLSQILGIAVQDKGVQKRILTSYLVHEGPINEFWNDLHKITGDNTSAQKIQTALKLGVLSGNQPDVMNALFKKKYQSENIFHDLAGMDKSDWVNFVKDLSKQADKSVVPSFIEGKDENERVEIYGGKMAKMLEASLPTHSFFGKLAKQKPKESAFASQKDLVKFFVNNPSFDLKQTPTHSISEDPQINFNGITDKNLLIQELQSIQRLSVYTNDFNVISTLKLVGLDAAYNIVKLPEKTFSQTYSQAIGSREAAQMFYRGAEKKFMQSLMIWSKVHPNLSIKTTTTPYLIADPVANSDLRTMFGSLEACECEHCTSVFSPAAYYTDILNFLYSRTPDVYNELIRRRPDLIKIELNCKNTNTLLPYIDLVNELLENFVLTHKNPAVAVPASYQTTWQAKELAANPEHINYLAYDELKKAVFPWVLPLNMPVEEARVYLKHLGMPRHQLMATFFAGTKEAAFDDFNINMERLNITFQEAKILSGETKGVGSSNSGLWNFYGFDKATGYKPFTDPADSSKQISDGNWMTALTGRIDVFLQQTELVYKELLTLLLCNCINPVTGRDGEGNEVRIISIVSIDGDNASCELSNLRLSGATTTHLRKIHRFLRLWRKLGWSMFDLDKAANVFDLDFGSSIQQNKANLNKIAQTAFLTKHLALPVENVLALWSDISTASYIDYTKDNYPKIESLYEKLFLLKAVLNPVDQRFEDFNALEGALDDYTATLFSAMQISDEEYSYLKEELLDEQLTLHNLSLLYRNALLARKLELGIKDFLWLKKLIGASADPFASPVSTFSFLLKADTVKTAPFSIEQLNYMLRHDYLEETAVAPTDGDISVFLSQLRSSLRAINNSSADEQRSTIVQKFSEKLKITAVASGLLLQTHVRSIIEATRAVVEDFRADDFSSFSFLQTYTDISDPENPKDFEPVFVREDPTSDPTIVAIPDLFNDYTRLEKIATLINQLKLSDTDLEFIVVNSDALQCTNLTQLPLVESIADFSRFETLINLIKARDTMPVGNPDFFGILLHAISSLPDKTKWLDNVTARTNWDRQIIEELVGNETSTSNAGILMKTFPQDFRNGNVILQIKDCLAVLHKTGLSTTLVKGTIAADFEREVSDAIKNTAKAKYDEAQWLKLAKPLRDDLREKQREALVAYVVAHADFKPAEGKFERWKNSDELYEYLLIDVEMKPMSITSRIKQAICSVQLFIDRVLMNLEHPDGDPARPVFKLEADQVKEWEEWRKIYRIWEANRKIFLYPENWIEPELRDDKSPFFKDLETQLKQNELNEGNVEDAFHGYLEKLDEVARLEVIGLYHQVETGIPDENNMDILHVFARTNTNPHKYFHRTLENGEWTPWKKLEIDIDGNHIVPVVFNRKLCLFWLFFTQDADESTSFSDQAPRFWKIQAAWSEYRNNKWTAKKLSVKTLESERCTTDDELEEYKRKLVLRAWINEPGNGFSQTNYDGRLHLQINNDSSGADDAIARKKAAFIFETTNNDPDLIQLSSEENIAVSSGRPPATQYNQQMIESIEPGRGLSVRILNMNRDISLPVLGDSPYSIFKLYVPANEISPYEKEFFFHDTINTFLVEYSPVQEPPMTESNDLANWIINLQQNWDELHPTPNERVLNFSSPVNGIDEHFKNPTARKAHPAKVIEPQTIELEGITVNVHGNKKLATVDTTTLQALSLPSENKRSLAENRSMTSDSNNIILFLGNIFFLTPTNSVDRFTFTTFHHAHVKTFIRELNKHGIQGLLKSEVQTQDDNMNFDDMYAPTGLVTRPRPTNKIDFTYGSAYSQYNWELFFHVPMLIACRLKDDQRFADARQWFHYIFNPTNSEGGGKERFWQFKPFYEEAGKEIQTLNDLLQNETELEEQVRKWMDNPFKPHVIARMRISAYMKNVVMKYLDNLIAWGDNLFRRDSIEAINEATNLYILAAKILGERPSLFPPRATHHETTFDAIKDERLDAFSNAMVQIETIISPSATASPNTSSGISNALGEMFYFCVPRNEYLLEYWDTVADRLFKIRHSMNLEGLVRMLPLFEPPIDPAMLVRAAAAGMDLSSILSDMNVGLPHYRFNFMLQKANEYINEVKTLGSSLLQVLEKRDAEALALLRSAHEQKMLNAMLSIRDNQVKDASVQLESIRKSKENTQLKYNYYNSRERINYFEQQHLNSIQTGMIYSLIQGELNFLGGLLAAIPNLKIGAPTSMGATWGGDNLGAVMNAISTYIGIFAAINNAQGSMAGTMGGYTRRMDDWQFQANSASKELEQLDKQISSAEIKLAVAEKELQNHELQIENNKKVDEFMRNKFTNQELYDWMIGQISTVYFQSYQLAYDLAKKAEKCYQHELGEYENASFIQFGYWDSLKKGLLSAEKLQYDLHRMENSFYDKNKREYELTKHISLALLDPLALIKLKSTDECEFEIPEALYDMDHPGHFFRRIKSVSISIPCIAGPYTSVSANLSLKENCYRKNNVAIPYAEVTEPVAESDVRFEYNRVSNQYIATSSGQNDNGTFELNFRDERYLPFEGAGAISKWSLSLPTEVRQFDYNTISDVIIHLKYTAKEGGTDLKDEANRALLEQLAKIKQRLDKTGLHIAISVRHDMPNEWHLLKNRGAIDLTIDKLRLPYFAQVINSVKVENVVFIARGKNNFIYSSIQIKGTNLDMDEIDNLKLYKGERGNIELNSSFELSMGEAELLNLEELMLIVKYGF